MVTVHWYELSFDGEYAVKNGDSIVVYDADYNEIQRISNLSYRDDDFISISGGEWTAQSEIPTAQDRTDARMDFIEMRQDYLETKIEGGSV